MASTSKEPSLKLEDVEEREHLSYVDVALHRSSANLKWTAGKARQTFDNVSPIKSDDLQERWQVFSSNNPTLAAFLLINVVFSGVPILLFSVFSLSTLIFSLLSGIVLGIIGALVVTSSIVGFGTLFIVPTLLLTTIAASTLFFWATIGLWIYNRYDRGQYRE